VRERKPTETGDSNFVEELDVHALQIKERVREESSRVREREKREQGSRDQECKRECGPTTTRKAKAEKSPPTQQRGAIPFENLTDTYTRHSTSGEICKPNSHAANRDTLRGRREPQRIDRERTREEADEGWKVKKNTRRTRRGRQEPQKKKKKKKKKKSMMNRERQHHVTYSDVEVCAFEREEEHTRHGADDSRSSEEVLVLGHGDHVHKHQNRGVVRHIVLGVGLHAADGVLGAHRDAVLCEEGTPVAENQIFG
jgi:hypothetical protein